MHVHKFLEETCLFDAAFWQISVQKPAAYSPKRIVCPGARAACGAALHTSIFNLRPQPGETRHYPARNHPLGGAPRGIGAT